MTEAQFRRLRSGELIVHHEYDIDSHHHYRVVRNGVDGLVVLRVDKPMHEANMNCFGHYWAIHRVCRKSVLLAEGL